MHKLTGQKTKNSSQENSLLKRIVIKGLSEEQAAGVLLIVCEFAKEKFPLLKGIIHSFLKQELKQLHPDLGYNILYVNEARYQQE